MEPYWDKIDPKEAARRRRINRIMILVIGAAILVFVALSPTPGAWVGVLGIFVVVAGLFYARSIVYRNMRNKMIIEEAELKEQNKIAEENEQTESEQTPPEGQ